MAMQSQQLALQQKSQNQPLPAQSVAMQIVPVQAEMTRSVDPRVAAMKNKLDKEQQKKESGCMHGYNLLSNKLFDETRPNVWMCPLLPMHLH
jgi:hypothetical protein